jgi:O-antigen/teichoic acid export membrane protein
LGGVLDWHLIGWFYALLVFDQISYETVRHLMSTEQPVRSNFIHTLRTGFWVLPVAVLFVVYPPSRSLNTVFGMWLAASVASVALSFWWMRGLGIGKALKVKVDWSWLKSGWDTTLQYVPVTLSMFAFTLLDRYAIEELAPASNGVEPRMLLGAYAAYTMMANLVVTFPEAGMVSIMGPKMIRAYREGRPEEFDSLHKYLGWNLAKSVLVTSVVATLGMGFYLLLKQDEPVYLQNMSAFFVSLAAAVCNAMAMWPRLRLFAAGKDKLISWMHVLGVLPFLGLLWLLVPRLGVLGAALALLVGFAIRLVLALYWAAQTPAPPAAPQSPADNDSPPLDPVPVPG